MKATDSLEPQLNLEDLDIRHGYTYDVFSLQTRFALNMDVEIKPNYLTDSKGM